MKPSLFFVVAFFCCGLLLPGGDGYALEIPAGSKQTMKMVIQILDENGRPTAAKIRITAQDSIYYAPDGHLTDFTIGEGGVDALLGDSRRFAYVEGTFTINLPAGVLRFEIIKGFAYSFVDSTINITPGTDSVKLSLQKWFDYDSRKWYGGDIHVHYIDPVSASMQMKAEDLQVCNILTSDCTTDQDKFRASVEPGGDTAHLVYVNQEFREDQLGHMILLNLKKLLEPVKTMRRYQYPLNSKACDETHAQGGHVSWAHFAAWPGLEGPLAVVLKKVDAVELLSTIDPFCEPIFVSEVVPDLRMNSGLKLWYRLLNCGLRIPATAGTDKMTNRVTVGANRVYAIVKGRFNYQSWIDALNKGSSFVTNSPFLLCKADRKDPGEELGISPRKTIRIMAEVWSQLPVDRLEIIANGTVIAEKIVEKGEHHAKLQIEYQPGISGWVAARAYQYGQEDMRNGVSFYQRRDFGGGSTTLNGYYGTMRPETPFAHTNPIYIKVPGRPMHPGEDAQYFVKYLTNAAHWLEHTGRFPSATAKKEVLDSYNKGIRAFDNLAK